MPVGISARTTPARELQYRDGRLTTGIAAGTRKQLLEGTWDATSVLLEAGDAIEATARNLPYMNDYSS